MKALLIPITILILGLAVNGQEKDPEFIGEAYVLKANDAQTKLDKELGDFTSGMSFSANSWKALSLEIAGGKANARFPTGEPLHLVVRAADNNSDPLAIISIYRLKAKKKSRSVLLSKDNSGTFLKSRTNSKDLVNFNGKKYGTSSYLIDLKDLTAGEYGIVVSNPNSRDEKRVVVSCFAVD